MDNICAETTKKKGKIIEGYQQTSTIESLHPEVLQNILSRLPIISLLQAKLVCRLWRNLMSDRLFIDLHLSRMSENDPCLILQSDFPIQNQLYLVNSEVATKIHAPEIPKFKVVGSCNGLLCLCDLYNKNVANLYNPFTRNCVELPKAEKLSEKEAVVFGFGFLPATNEYKVVRIVYYRNKDDIDNLRSYYPRRSEVQVLTIGSFSWRNIGPASHQLEVKPSHALVNGRLHWLSRRNRSTKPPQIIVSFDLQEEQFRQVAEPNFPGIYYVHDEFHLAVLRGRLALVIHSGCFQREIWIMEEYNVKDSWIKAFSIGVCLPKDLNHDKYYHFVHANRHLSNARVLCIRKNGEILLACNREALMSYEQKSGTFKQFIFPLMPHMFEPFVHISSLNWID